MLQSGRMYIAYSEECPVDNLSTVVLGFDKCTVPATIQRALLIYDYLFTILPCRYRHHIDRDCIYAPAKM